MRPLVGIVCDFQIADGMASHRAGDEYVTAIRDGVGALPLLIPATVLPVPEMLARVDGLLFTGGDSNIAPSCYGGADPRPGTLLDEARDAAALPLLRAAIAAAKPVLCICRGFQELNVALGGTLHQHLQELPGRLDHREKPGLSPDQAYAPVHAVRFTPGGLLARLTGAKEAMVNSLHEQGVDRLAIGLAIEATAQDGQIEAVSGKQGFLLGVQWHPEWRWVEDAVSRAIFGAFGKALS
jgi:putative glutamine amidotransferase